MTEEQIQDRAEILHVNLIEFRDDLAKHTNNRFDVQTMDIIWILRKLAELELKYEAGNS